MLCGWLEGILKDTNPDDEMVSSYRKVLMCRSDELLKTLSPGTDKSDRLHPTAGGAATRQMAADSESGPYPHRPRAISSPACVFGM